MMLRKRNGSWHFWQATSVCLNFTGRELAALVAHDWGLNVGMETSP